jgi:TolB-like protein/tetratricopeptide (TPR) repeat protein
MASLLAELKRRNVYRVALAYLILGWIVLQITDIVAPALHLPEWTITLVTFLGIIGFPFAMFFTWAFEMTPKGLKRTAEVHPDESISHETGSQINRLIFAMMAMAILVLLVDRLFYRVEQSPATSEINQAAGESMATASAVDSQPASAAAGGKPRSIAVLPFVNMSNDPDQEFFSDGISEELLNGLARIGELRVAARTSSFAFKGKNQDITEIGNKLNVETVLEGSVRKSGKRIRITAQLINVNDGFHLWSDTYDRDLTDIFVIQDEISAAIIDALRVHLTDEEVAQPRAKVVSEKDVLGYEYFLLARYELRKRQQNSVALALSLYEQSLTSSPDFAPALAGKALAVYFNSEDQYGTMPRLLANRQAEQLAGEALKLDPKLTDAHGTLGLIAMDRWEIEAALQHFDNAIQLSPSQGILYNWKSNALGQLGRSAESREVARTALQLDPMHPVARSNWMVQLWTARDFEQLDKFYKSLGDDKPWIVSSFYAAVLKTQGEFAAGHQHQQRILADSGAGAQARLRTTRYDLYWLAQTNLDPALSPMDQWNLRTRWETPGNILAMATLVTGDEQERLNFILPLSGALIELGRYDEALVMLERRTPAQRSPILPNGLERNPLEGLLLEALLLQRMGKTEESRQLLDQLEAFVSGQVDSGSFWLLIELARLHTLREEPEAALQALAQAIEYNDVLWVSRWDPVFASLRDNPEFIALFAGLDAHINAERTKLGWPPAEFSR